MRDQLQHLAQAAAQPNIIFQVLPFGAGAQPGLLGPFSMLRFPEGYSDMDAVYVENQRGAIWQERPVDIKYYTQVFEQLRTAALTPENSVDLVDSLASSL